MFKFSGQSDVPWEHKVRKRQKEKREPYGHFPEPHCHVTDGRMKSRAWGLSGEGRLIMTWP